MSIEEAVFSILGDETGHAIIAEQGIHWGVLAAMAAATTNDDQRAVAAIRQGNVDQKGNYILDSRISHRVEVYYAVDKPVGNERQNDQD